MKYLKILSFLSLIVIWQLLHFIFTTESYELPSIIKISTTIPIIFISGSFLKASLFTLLHIIICCSIALFLGFSLGYVFFRKKSIYEFFRFPLDFIRSIPAILIYYLLIAIIGLSHYKKMILLGLYLAIPTSIYIYSTLFSTDKRFSYVSHTLQLHPSSYRWKVLFPASLQSLLGNVRVIISWCIVLVLVFELFTANFYGIGALIYDYYEMPDKSFLVSSVILVGIIGYIINFLDSIIGSCQ